MSEFKGTQGPWHIRTLDESSWTIDDAFDNSVAQAQQIKPLRVDMAQIERSANARLIAAAPELLDAIKKMHRELYACQAVIHLAGGFDPAYVKGAQEAIKTADDAIAKATGD